MQTSLQAGWQPIQSPGEVTERLNSFGAIYARISEEVTKAEVEGFIATTQLRVIANGERCCAVVVDTSPGCIQIGTLGQ